MLFFWIVWYSWYLSILWIFFHFKYVFTFVSNLYSSFYILQFLETLGPQNLDLPLLRGLSMDTSGISNGIGGEWFRGTVFLKRWHLNKDLIKGVEKTLSVFVERAIQVGFLEI